MQRWNFPFKPLEIAKMYLHTADYNMKKPCGIYELKNIQSILRRKSYDIMHSVAGKKNFSVEVAEGLLLYPAEKVRKSKSSHLKKYTEYIAKKNRICYKGFLLPVFFFFVSRATLKSHSVASAMSCSIMEISPLRLQKVFFVISSGESYCNDRSKEFSKSRNILKSIQSILRRKIAYVIMLAGKKELKCL